MSLTVTKRPVSTRLLLTLAVALLSASGCTGKGVATGSAVPAKPSAANPQAAPARNASGPARGAAAVAPVLPKRADAQLLPLTRVSAPAFVASSGGRSLTGSVLLLHQRADLFDLRSGQRHQVAVMVRTPAFRTGTSGSSVMRTVQS